MTAVRLLARAELRARWRLWVVLGLLAGATAGLAAAGVAGARRTADAFPRYAAATPTVDAAVLANDPEFDEDVRAEVAELPEVDQVYPFSVPFFLEVAEPRGVEASLVPLTPATQALFAGPVVEGRAPDPEHADEVVVDENIRDEFDLDVGSTLVFEQTVPPGIESELPIDLPDGVDTNFRQPMEVVGVIKSVSEETNLTPSSGFYEMYGDRLVGVVNIFADLKGGESRVESFQQGVAEAAGRPVNVERASDLFGTRQIDTVTGIEEAGLFLFSLAVVIGGGVLIGQALVRAVSAGAGELESWRAIGAGRRIAVGALVAPAALAALAGAVVTIIVAIALSARFPIGVARNYDLDLGYHADWLVIALGALALAVVVMAIAWLTAELRVARRESDAIAPSTAGDVVARAGLPPALVVGSRLAIEPGRGRRSVPVRSALIGAITGVLGVVACFTFRAGITDAIESPQRSGVVWDEGIISISGELDPETISRAVDDPDVESALTANWARAVDINGMATPTFGTEPLKGNLDLVVLEGHAPNAPDEIAFAPTTMSRLGVGIGDEVTIGENGDRTATVVGKALVPATSHTDYDQSAWVTNDTLHAVLPPPRERAPEDVWGYLLVNWAPDTDVPAAEARFKKLVDNETVFAGPAELPTAVAELENMRPVALALGVFFGLLACATVAHALVTTVRRRRPDLAVLRAIGFTPAQSRLAIAWQATLLAVAGLIVGIPLGIIFGRAAWRWLTDTYPLVYAPPLSVLVILLALPAAIALANALAAGPARSAARTRPAETLRTE